MKRAAILALLALSGCSGAQVSQAITDGQLFCAMTTGNGSPLTVSVQNALNDTPILAKNNTAAYVNAICGLIGAIPVSPPVSVADIPTVAVNPAVALARDPR